MRGRDRLQPAAAATAVAAIATAVATIATIATAVAATAVATASTHRVQGLTNFPRPHVAKVRKFGLPTERVELRM